MSALNHDAGEKKAHNQAYYRANRDVRLKTALAWHEEVKWRKQECDARHPYRVLLSRLAALPAPHVAALNLPAQCARWGCHAPLAPGMAVCDEHWHRVPNHVRDEIFAIARAAGSAGPFALQALKVRLIFATDCAIRAVQHREREEL